MAWPISPHTPFSIHMDYWVSYTYFVLCKCSKVYAKQKTMQVRKDLRSICNYSTQTLAENNNEAKHQTNFLGTAVLGCTGTPHEEDL